MQQTLPNDKIVMCGDPVMLYATSNKAGEAGCRMTRVVCEVTCGGRTEPLSCTVSNENKVARFNLSDTLTGFVDRQEQLELGADGVPVKLNAYKMSFSYKLYDAYFCDGEKTSPISEEENLWVKAGRSSDYRLLGHGATLPFLSLKQKSFGEEHVLRGFPYLVSEETSENLSGIIRHKTYEFIMDRLNLCVIDYNPMMHHPIIFRNSFGELETCLAWCRQKIDVKVQQEVYVTSRAAYDGQRTQLVSAYDDEMQIALSSGCVTPMWAQWWTFEPLRSRRAWIWMPTDLTTAAGCWVPCVLKADNNTILDRSKGASEINFTAVLDWQGGLL